MVDFETSRFLRLVRELFRLLPSPAQFGLHRKGRKKPRNCLRLCIFAVLVFHLCGCDLVFSPISEEGYRLFDLTTSQGQLHPVTAAFTVLVGARPSSLTSVSVRASTEMEFFPDRTPESVYLIYPSDPGRGLSASQPPLAAAFVLKALDPEDSSQSHFFLVTARHAIDPRWAGCAETNPRSIVLRLNRSIGGVGYETVLLQSGSLPTFLTSSDPTVDLALIRLDITAIANLSDYKLLVISSDDLLTSSDLPFLRKNLPVRTAGYPASFAQGEVRYPIRSLGSISLNAPLDREEYECSWEFSPITHPRRASWG
jgi:hypothetical protein